MAMKNLYCISVVKFTDKSFTTFTNPISYGTGDIEGIINNAVSFISDMKHISICNIYINDPVSKTSIYQKTFGLDEFEGLNDDERIDLILNDLKLNIWKNK